MSGAPTKYVWELNLSIGMDCTHVLHSVLELHGHTGGSRSTVDSSAQHLLRDYLEVSDNAITQVSFNLSV